MGGESIGARAGDSVCGAVNRMALVRLSGPTLSRLSPRVLQTVTPQGYVTAEATYGAAHVGHEVLAWSRAT